MLPPVALTAIATERPLADYAALERALSDGRSVRTVIGYAKCTLEVDGKTVAAPRGVGGMALDAWEWFDKGVVRNDRPYVASSLTVLIVHPSYGHVFNYVRLRIFKDGEVKITARYLQPTDYKVVMDETFTGRISNGKDRHAVRFFAR